MLSDWLFRIRALLRRTTMEDELDDELHAHVAHQIEAYVKAGASPEDAKRRVRLEFGGVDQIKEECRDARGVRMLDDLWRDVCYGARVLGRQRGFSLLIVVTLALGIGANMAIFSVTDAALLRPLPYRDPDRLVAVYENHFTRGVERDEFAAANFFDLRAAGGAWEDLAAYASDETTLTSSGEAELVEGGAVTSNAFGLLGAKAQLGRALLPGDDRLSGPRVVVLSDRLWRRKFGADARIVGRSITLDGRSHTVVGVMPTSFRFPGTIDEFWVPLRFDARGRQERSNHNYSCIGRLSRTATLRSAQAQADTIARRLRADYPATNGGVGFRLVDLREAVSGRVRGALLVLLASVGFVLLIACANVANLVLTRSSARRKELAVRAALGASRLRLLRQLLTESLVLAAVGGAMAIGVCTWAIAALGRMLPAALVPAGAIAADARVLAFGLAVSLLAGTGCGLAPAFLLRGTNLHDWLNGSSRASTAGRWDLRMREVLVASEVALALVLLTGAGLLFRSFLQLQAVDAGVRAEGVLAVRFAAPGFAYSEHAHRIAFYHAALERVEQLPGARSAGLITSLPFAGPGGSSWFTIEGRHATHPEELIASNRLVTPDYFRTMGIPLRRGRAIEPRDSATAPLVALVNEAMARRFWGREDPVGRRFKFGLEDSDKPWIEVVGIVGDVRQNGLAGDSVPEIYRPFVQDEQWWLAPRALVVRAAGSPLALAAAVRRALAAAGPDVPIYSVDALGDLVSDSVATPRVNMLVMFVFASVALGLALVGVYGVVAYTAAQRGREIAIRMALGAGRGQVIGLMLAQRLPAVLGGIGIGLALAAALTRFMAALLHGVRTTDAATFAGVALIMLAVSALASCPPAYRATRLDPVETLRNE